MAVLSIHPTYSIYRNMFRIHFSIYKYKFSSLEEHTVVRPISRPNSSVWPSSGQRDGDVCLVVLATHTETKLYFVCLFFFILRIFSYIDGLKSQRALKSYNLLVPQGEGSWMEGELATG